MLGREISFECNGHTYVIWYEIDRYREAADAVWDLLSDRRIPECLARKAVDIINDMMIEDFVAEAMR